MTILDQCNEWKVALWTVMTAFLIVVSFMFFRVHGCVDSHKQLKE